MAWHHNATANENHYCMGSPMQSKDWKYCPHSDLTFLTYSRGPFDWLQGILSDPCLGGIKLPARRQKKFLEGKMRLQQLPTNNKNMGGGSWKWLAQSGSLGALKGPHDLLSNSLFIFSTALCETKIWTKQSTLTGYVCVKKRSWYFVHKNASCPR